MAKQTLYFDSRCGYDLAAVAENGKLTALNFEKADGGVRVGNVYKGRVESVLKGMQAAFINCGLERNCYISAEDKARDADAYESNGCGAQPFPELKEGDELPVQITKLPVGTKGARVTADLSFIGKSVIYTPLTRFIGVSRKIADGELRKNLLFGAERLLDKGEGLIVRTAAPYAKRDCVETELNYLRALYGGVAEGFGAAKVGDLLYAESDLPARVLRDTMSYDIEKIIVGTEKLEKSVSALVKRFSYSGEKPVILHAGRRDMLSEAGLAGQIFALASPRVGLDNGAYLVIEKTEALTVIDVNTGKFTGDYNLEQTVYHTNIAAAREIARQVRLRNIGGIVVVDFIDMQSAAHRKALTDELERALKKDGAKCSVSPVSKLGLVEFSRKRTGASPLPHMVGPCSRCRGTGLMQTAEFAAFGIRAEILNLADGGAKTIRLDVSAELFPKFREWSALWADISGICGNVEIYAVPHRSYGFSQVSYSTPASANFSVPDNAVKIL